MRRTIAVVAVMWFGSGCTLTARYQIEPQELNSLDGFDAKNERTMMATVPTTYMVGKTMVAGTAQVPELVTDKPYRLIHPGGRAFDFNSGSNLAFLTSGGATELLHWRSITFGGGALSAVPMKAAHSPLNVPTADLEGAVFEVPSLGRTCLVYGLWTGGIGTVVGVAGWGLSVVDPRNTGAIVASIVGGSAALTGLTLALVSLALDRNSDADADGIKLGTLGSAKK